MRVARLETRFYSTDLRFRPEQLAWAHRRLAAVDKMEAKLREMRALAEYAASRARSETEVAQVQE